MSASIRLASLLAAVLLLLPRLLPAQTTELVIIGGSAVPGGTAAVEIALTGPDAALAVGASMDIAFPADIVTPPQPVRIGCRVDERLAETHQVAGRLVEPGVVAVEVLARRQELHSLGEGRLVVCDFGIAPGATAAAAPLTFAFAGLNDTRGLRLPVTGVAGAIAIGTATPCAGDCDGSGAVTITELIRGVRIALGEAGLDLCPAMDGNGSGTVTISELITAVNRVLDDCAAA